MRKTLNILIITAVAILSTVAVDAQDASQQPVININTASVEQLVLLPRVGPKVAQRIVDWRTEHGPFVRSTDLMQIKGIGAKSYDLLARYLVVDGKTTLDTKQKVVRNKPTKPAE